MTRPNSLVTLNKRRFNLKMTSTQPHCPVVAHTVCVQEQVSGGTTNTVLRNLLSDTPYKVTVVPVYPEGEGLRQTDRGKTRELDCFLNFKTSRRDQLHPGLRKTNILSPASALRKPLPQNK